jgi:O-antigen/teichoic acid export membrane protein
MGMILVADSFINVFLGNKWADTVPILQLLCLGGIFSALESSNGDLLRIKEKTGTLLIFNILHIVLMISIIVITVLFRLNFLWMVVGISSIYFARYLFINIIFNRLIDYKVIEWCKDLFPYIFVSSISVLCGYILHYFISNKLILMLCQIPFVGILYIGILYLFGSVIVKEAIDLLKNKGTSFK